MLRFIDLFAGIGGFHLALSELGNTCVFSSEWDKYAQTTYEANFGVTPHGDISKINAKDIPEHDMLCAGFPCQPFSIAGVSKKNALGRKHGFEDETQGTLFFDIIRIAKTHKTQILLLENVKNLKSHDKGKTWYVIKNTLKEAGYSVFQAVLDGQHYVPQHRERIFLVCFRRDVYPNIDFTFPSPPPKRIYELKDVIDTEVDDKYTLSDKLWHYLYQRKIQQQRKGNGFGYGLFNPKRDTVTRTISARYYKDGSEVLIEQEGKNPRRLTPRECARLQGFPESFNIPVSDTRAYKQFGNSVVVPLVKDVAHSVFETLKAYKEGKARQKGRKSEQIALDLSI